MSNTSEAEDDGMGEEVMIADDDVLQVIDEPDLSLGELGEALDRPDLDAIDDDEEGDDSEEDDTPSGAPARRTIVDLSTAQFNSHVKAAFCIALSPDGSVAVSGGEDDMAYLWSTTNGAQLHSLSGHCDSVVSVAFNRPGDMVATGAMDGIIKVWSVTTGTQVCELDAGDDLTFTEWHPKANFLIAGTDGGSAYMWDVPGGRTSFFSGHGASVSAGGWAPDGRSFATVSEDGSLVLWSPKSREIRERIDQKRDVNFHAAGAGITMFCWSPSGEMLATAAEDGSVCLVSTKSYKVVGHITEGEGAQIESLCISDSNLAKIAVGMLSGSLRVYDVNTKRLLHTLIHCGGVISCKWLGKMKLASLALDCKLRTWDLATGRASEEFDLSSDPLGLAVTADGATAATCGEDGGCRMFKFS